MRGGEVPSIRKVVGLLLSPWAWKHLLRTQTAAAVEHLEMLRYANPTTVIDVGANKGQFALVALAAGASRVISFEPLTSEAAIYRKNFARSPRCTLYEFALADTTGEAILHVADRPDSSSLLPLGAGQKEAFRVGEARTTKVAVKRLDDVIESVALGDRVLVKIDVQGAEGAVIRGSKGLLEKVQYVYAEGSFVELYEGQLVAGELVQLMDNAGFTLRGIYNVTHTKNYGATQADFLFENQYSRSRS